MQIFGRCVGAALAAGNVCVVKPAENHLPVTARGPARGRGGLSRGRITIVTGYGHEWSNALARHGHTPHPAASPAAPGVGTLIQQAAAERHCP